MTNRSDRDTIGLTAAAERLGVHYQTAYKWVRDGTLPAVRVGRTYEVDTTDVDDLAERRATPTAPPRRRPHLDRAAARVLAALVAGDEHHARAMVRRLAAEGVPATRIAERLVAPALREIGEAWHRGEVSVPVEHRATAIAERMLADVMPNPRGRRRGTAVVAGLPGDRHGLPSLMAAVALRDDRWHVEHVGTDVPEHELRRFVDHVGAALVVLTAVMDVAAAEAMAERLRAGGDRRVLVGGPGETLDDLVVQARDQRAS